MGIEGQRKRRLVDSKRADVREKGLSGKEAHEEANGRKTG